MLSANSGIALAAYGPASFSAGTVPGGFSCVVTSQTVGPAGKLIGPIRVGGLEARVAIRRGTFPVQVQVTINEPDGAGSGCSGGLGIGDGGFRGFRAVGGVGILIQHNGSAYIGTLSAPISVRLSSAQVGSSSLVVVWNGKDFVPAPASVGPGSATIGVLGSGDYVVLSPGAVRRLDRRGLGPGRTPARPGVGTTEGFFAAALLWPAAGPPPGAGVLRATRTAAADASRATRLP
jgi:hypothetical protein